MGAVGSCRSDADSQRATPDLRGYAVSAGSTGPETEALTCDRCLQPLADAEHGIGLCPYEARTQATAAVLVDDIPGGMVIENLADHPITVYSWSERRRQMQLHGVEEFIRHVPGDHHVNSWAMTDAQTLENARILVSRSSRAGSSDDVEQYPVIETYVKDSGDIARVLVAR